MALSEGVPPECGVETVLACSFVKGEPILAENIRWLSTQLLLMRQAAVVDLDSFKYVLNKLTFECRIAQFHADEPFDRPLNDFIDLAQAVLQKITQVVKREQAQQLSTNHEIRLSTYTGDLGGSDKMLALFPH